MASGNSRERLRAYITTETAALRGTLRLYVLRAGLAYGDAVEAAADDLLNAVVSEALAHAERFRPEGEPKPWLLGIAANLIRRQQADIVRRERREPLVRDLESDVPGALAEDELFDRLAALAAQEGPEAALASEEAAAELLARVSAEDREILQFAILHEMDGRALAHAMHITPGAARVRLHRALNRLRTALAAEGVSQ